MATDEQSAMGDVGGGAATGATIGGPWGALIGAAAGAGKYFIADRGRQARDAQLAAATQKYSPWTKIQAQPIHYADPVGTTMQGAFTGLAMGQQGEQMKQDQEMRKAQMDYFNRSAPTAGAESLANAGATPGLPAQFQTRDSLPNQNYYNGPAGVSPWGR